MKSKVIFALWIRLEIYFIGLFGSSALFFFGVVFLCLTLIKKLKRS